VIRSKAKLCFRGRISKCEKLRALSPPVYSTHLNLPNNHSINILKVTKDKKITILIIKPLDHITIGVIDIIISSKSKIKKIIQKIKKTKRHRKYSYIKRVKATLKPFRTYEFRTDY